MRRTTDTIHMRLAGVRSRYLLDRRLAAALRGETARAPAALLVDARMRRRQAARVGALLEAAGPAPPVLGLAGGETVKDLDHLGRVYAWLAEHRLPRDGVLVGIGGGALLDLAGLAASTWARGIRLVAVPTTLLAMVDAALGGKTAINAAGLKNPVGTFHPASVVLVDPGFLATLPRSEWRSGLAELIKSAIVGSPRLCADLHRHRRELAGRFARGRRDRAVPQALRGLPWRDWILAAARVKARIVSADFREAGPRQALNLGHTLGHALETHARCSHGEAIAVGMAAVARVAVGRGLRTAADGRRLLELLECCGLPTVADPPPPAILARLLAGDKKHAAGSVRWVLPERPGLVRLGQAVSLDEIVAAARGDRPRPTSPAGPSA